MPGTSDRTGGEHSTFGNRLSQGGSLGEHRQQTHRIGLGPHQAVLSPENSKTMRLTAAGETHQGGRHRNHKGRGHLGVESNHVPPKQVMLGRNWKYSDGTVWSARNGSAIELDYEDHRVVSTTGTANEPHLRRLNAALDAGDMEEALALEITDLKSKLAYHNVREVVDPNFDDTNHHARPEKNIDKYDGAFRDMISDVYPELKGSQKLQDLIGPMK